MPKSYKAIIGAYVIFAIGAALIVAAAFVQGWSSMAYLAYGLITAGAGLTGVLVFSVICAVASPAWRKRSGVAAAIGIVLGVVLFLVGKAA
jgi:hypothetical protein